MTEEQSIKLIKDKANNATGTRLSDQTTSSLR